MRFVVYLAAVLAAAGIVYFVSNSGAPVADNATEKSADPASSVSVPADVAGVDSAAAAGEVHLVNLRVPDMHCPFACYPSVKKTLEGQAGVAGVDLVEQKEEGVIDNPVVIVSATSSFDLDKALAALEETGFKGQLEE